MSLVPCLDCGLPCCDIDNNRLTENIHAWGRIFYICTCPVHKPDPAYLRWEDDEDEYSAN